MSFSDWLIDIALIGLVVLQVRPRRLTVHSLLLPLALVCWAGFRYLHALPTSGNDLLLIAPAALAGLALGTGAGVLTRVYRRGGDVLARASAAAAVLWVLGVGVRLAFQLYSTHGGGPSIGRFSVDHQIGLDAWAPALILMAFGEVLARTAVVWLRGSGVRRSGSRRPDQALSA